MLVHGLFGFDRLRLVGLTLVNYFPTVPELLQSAGNRVFVPYLSPTAGVAARAAELKAFIDRELPGERVHIIAHSMGGLDSRYMISRLGMESRVLSLTTLGTPHRGTVFADWAIPRLRRMVEPVLDFLGMPKQGFLDLTRSACRTFNEQVPDVPAVRYFSVAGKHDANLLNPEWLLPYFIVALAEGPNDGVVSIESASYGEHVHVWEGDHFSLANWPHPLGRNRGPWREPGQLYGMILQRLKDAGFQ